MQYKVFVKILGQIPENINQIGLILFRWGSFQNGAIISIFKGEAMSDRDITEKREHERKLTNVEVEIVSRGEVKKANAKDVSLSGIFIKNIRDILL